MNLSDIENGQISLFLLFLIICINYIGNTLNCSIQKILIESRLSKIIIVFCTLFVFVIITNIHYKKKNPSEILKISIILTIFYIIATKNKPPFILIFIVSSFFVYYIQLYKEFHYEKMNKQVKEKNFTLKQIMLGKFSDFEPKIRDLIKLIKIQYYLFILSIVIICIGFFHYYYIKRIQYSKNWSFTKFLLGNNICKSTKNIKN